MLPGVGAEAHALHSVDNPWEVFPKAAVGQPGQPMPGGLGLGWTAQQIADVVAWMQTLPTE